VNSRERVYKTLRFDHPDRVPRDLWVVMATDMARTAEVDGILTRFPMDVVYCSAEGGWNFQKKRNAGLHFFKYGPSARAQGIPYQVGTYVDAWGVPFEVGEVGVFGEVKHPPLADWAALEHFSPPWEILDGGNWDDVNRFCDETDRFVISNNGSNPFERIQFLRGTEQVFTDLAWGSPELLRLRDVVHEFCLKDIELWCKTNVDGVRFHDDWGAQNALLISPTMWREWFKPLYVDYCRLIHDAGKFAFFHTDGNVAAILPDLIEIGVDAINSQLFCMDIEELGRRYKGAITFWGEIDRQWALPFGRPEDVRQAVRRVRRALDPGNGGVIAQLQFGKFDPFETIVAAFEAWLE
jgi:uroporphyrinogen decarboxylase